MFNGRADPNTCKPSGKIRGPKPPKACNHQGSECCKQGELYDIYKCSPPVPNRTKAILMLLNFGNEDSHGPSECDDKFHSDKELVVDLSTGWFNKKKRSSHLVKIYGNGKSLRLKLLTNVTPR
ncbi:hypothetical protein F3Y22_tig00116951pilonHSYRG00883 [Hibiscus syriacus]|uniref:Uncharacterized protein n=1 Tax=Hibiscus syriacus TaxID=106335 RepID=A0A6A2XQY4_HIBSY|nr:hypothetical protein F3Y22_tig00116951pilonHSYRG00883 [Hibiscus syriacus]